MTTKHYVSFLFPGSLFDETTTREIPKRGDIGAFPKGAFGYYEWDREETMVNGELLTGETKHKGPMVYFGEVLTLAQVKKLEPRERYSILVGNMKSNGWKTVVRTIRGNFKPVTEDTKVIVTSVPGHVG